MAGVKTDVGLEYYPDGYSSLSNNPTPLEFDRFLPWILTGADVLENVAIIRLNIDDDPSKKGKKQSMRSFSRRALSQVDVSRDNNEKWSKRSAGSVKTNPDGFIRNAENVTTVTAYYTSNGQLTEVGFIKCQLPVPKIVLDAVQICLPYHPQLTRITWNGNYLTGALICGISKMLMDSFLTEVVLDNSCAPEQNYHVLLDSAHLKYLSLRNCEVNDEVCEKIAERIQRKRPGENLVALNLALNFITDKGAKALGHALRTNRRLSFLNLCCNSITSDGAAHILLPLTKFPLNPDEIVEAKKVRFELAQKKILANKTSVEQENLLYLGDITNLDKAGKKKRKISKNINAHKGRDQTEKTTDSEGIGAEDDIFLCNLEVSSRVWFSLGNLTLCSLNLAYNRLDFMAVSQIADVISYQYCEDRSPKIGLMRVVIEGNPLPKDCPEYKLIDKHMQLALNAESDLTENVGKNIKSVRAAQKPK